MVTRVRDFKQLQTILTSDVPKLVMYNQQTPSKHSVLGSVSCIYVRFPNSYGDKNEWWYEFDSHKNVMGLLITNAFAFNLKDLINLGAVLKDCFELGYYYDEPQPPQIYNFYLSKLGSDRYINDVIPSIKYVEQWQRFDFDPQLHRSEIDLDDESYKIWHRDAPLAFSMLECEGLSVDTTLFSKYFPNKNHLIDDGHVYTHYNLFTKTGRPSNSFGGINFAALKKDSGERKSFVTKYGSLVNIDFTAYHIQLILKHFGLPKMDDPHGYFAKLYFRNTANWNLPITSEEYSRGKQMTFQYLYGSIMDHQSKNIEFFNQVKLFGNKLYNDYLVNGTVTSPSNRQFIYDEILTENKVLNYYIQMLETEENIKQLMSILDNDLPVPVLYTYDSFVFDVKECEVDDLVHELQDILIYPFHVNVGETLDF